MDDLVVVEPRPRRSDSQLGRRPALSWAVLAVVAYVVSAAVVRLFDDLVSRAQEAQLVQETGPLYSVPCQACTRGPELVLAWLTDWRALLIWTLCLATATTAVHLSRSSRVPRAR